MIRVPPAREVASPVELTVTSMRCPGLEKAGSSAVTITAATFFTWMLAWGLLSPCRCRKLPRVWAVNLAWVVSPVPLRPTTSP